MHHVLQIIRDCIRPFHGSIIHIDESCAVPRKIVGDTSRCIRSRLHDLGRDVANDLWEVGLFAHLLQSSAGACDSYRKSLNILALFTASLLLLLGQRVL